MVPHSYENYSNNDGALELLHLGMACASAQQKRGTYRLKPHDQLTSFSYCALAITECNYFQPFKIYIGLERNVDAGVFVVFLLRKRGTLISEKIYI